MQEHVIHGFRLMKKEAVEELRSVLYLFAHEKSGAELLYIENDDDNKVFGAAFRTPPPDETGVAHILEHCVLSGSEKYRTKEPFMDLLKSSLATFLNAMTFPDKTIYPVASRNDQDFMNLTDVYLDAVFHPLIAEDERIFRQEGWRLELEDKDSPLRLSGVVYNEMRGAYSSPYQVLYTEVMKNLLPDTAYAANSGGEPYHIPELSYEDFKAFYKKYYHPSNARLFLYGKMDIAKMLRHIDGEYLSKFTAQHIDSDPGMQAPFKEKKCVRARYSLAAGEETKDKNYLAWAITSGRFDSVKENFMLEILANMLFSAQSAPVRNALIDAGLCRDVETEKLFYQQSSLAVLLLNAKDGESARCFELIEEVLEKETEKGLDREQLEAALNRTEYALREGSGYTTLGILYFIKSLDSWLYGGDPAEPLRYADVLKELREELDSDIWEQFVREKFLNNPHKLLLELSPEAGLNERKDKAAEEKLAEKKAAMPDEEIDALIEKTKALSAWQLADDSPEAKATIPKLKLQDIKTELPDPPCEVSEAGKDVVLEHPLFTNGINYLYMSFPLEHIEDDELFTLSLLRLLMGSIDTKKRDYKALDTALYLSTGGLHFGTDLLREAKSKKDIFRMAVSLKTLDPAGENWPALLSEVLNESIFTNDKRLKDLLEAEALSTEQSILNDGNSYGRVRLQAAYNTRARIREETEGISYYLKLKALLENFEEEKEGLKKDLEALRRKVFSRGNVILSLTGDEKDMPAFRKAALSCLQTLPEAEKKACERKAAAEPLREGIKISSNVQYVNMGYDYEKEDVEYKGDMTVLASYLARTYLHNRVRAKGGAYGAGLVIGTQGEISFLSYRDPQLSETLETFRNTAKWLRETTLSEAEIEELIIGSLNRFDPPLSPRKKGLLAYVRYLSGKSAEDAEKHLEEALHTSEASLKRYAGLLEKAAAAEHYCVVGNAAVLEKNKALFDRLIKI